MLLLDTHALVWVVEGSKRLGRRVSRLVDDALAGDGLGVASISFREMAMLVKRGRLAVDPSVEQWRLRVLGLGVHRRSGRSDHRGDGRGSRRDAGHHRRSGPRVARNAHAAGCAAIGSDRPRGGERALGLFEQMGATGWIEEARGALPRGER